MALTNISGEAKLLTSHWWGTCVLLVVVCPALLLGSTMDMKKLYDDVMKDGGYNKLVRPRPGPNETLTIIKIGLRLSQINAVDEKNQIVTTNVWLDQEWHDYKLTWEPQKYGNITKMYIKADELWIPDILLYNTAEGDFTIQMMTIATVHYNGLIQWSPPATYKFYCEIKVYLFPYDVQTCYMKFGSWSFENHELDLRHRLQPRKEDLGKPIIDGTDLSKFQGSTEWIILNATAKWNEKRYPCCIPAYSDITFYFTLKRKTLFYTVNLVMPCVAICIMTLFVFYLPADCQEKITCCITILNCLSFYLMIVYDIQPPTSFATPLIGRYILFTMVLLTLSIMMTVFVLNIHFRDPSTHTLSPWIRHTFLYVLPRLMFMRPPHVRPKPKVDPTGTRLKAYFRDNRHFSICEENQQSAKGLLSTIAVRRKSRYKPGTVQAMLGASYVAEYLKEDFEYKEVIDDWHYIAKVVDRLFLWFFTAVSISGTLGMFLEAKIYEES